MEPTAQRWPARWPSIILASSLAATTGCGDEGAGGAPPGSAGASSTTSNTGGSGGGTGGTSSSTGGGGEGGSVPPLPDCTKYVAASGTVEGKPASTTIQAGVDDLAPGDTLCVAPGSYHEVVQVLTDGTEALPITIRALDTTNKPVIDGEYILPAGEPSNAFKPFYSNVKCFEVAEDPNANQGPAPKQACWTWAYLVTIRADHVVWDSIDLTRARGHGVLIGNYNGPATEVRDVQFRNSEISEIRNEGVYIAGISGAVFRGNRVRDTNNFAAYSRQAPQIDWSGGNPTWTGGGPGWSGALYLYHAEDVAILDNEIFHNWGEGVGTGLFNDITTNTRIAGNEMYDNMSGQLYISNSSNVVAEKNVLYHTGDPDYYLNVPGYSACISVASEDGEHFEDVLIRNNVLSGCASMIGFGQYTPESQVSDVRIYNNTFINGGFALHSGSAALSLSGLVFVNNIAIGNPGNLPDLPNMVAHHNLWSAAPPAALSGDGDVVTSNAGLADSDYEPSVGAFDVAAIKLTSSSPARNAGTSVLEITDDFFDTARPAGANVDIGAHERD